MLVYKTKLKEKLMLKMNKISHPGNIQPIDEVDDDLPEDPFYWEK